MVSMDFYNTAVAEGEGVIDQIAQDYQTQTHKVLVKYPQEDTKTHGKTVRKAF